jgi:hypothetical protein
MTRILATAAILVGLIFSTILVGLGFSASRPSYSQQQRNLASDNGCFLWQDLKNGQCVAKETPTTPPPLPEQPMPAVSPALAAQPAVAPGPPAPPLTVASPPSENITRRPEPAAVCLGGELTVSGQCLCSGQVTMSGETYLLEYSRGKCLPMRCPVSEVKDGKCTASPTLQSTDAKSRKRRSTRLRRAIAMASRWR